MCSWKKIYFFPITVLLPEYDHIQCNHVTKDSWSHPTDSLIYITSINLSFLPLSVINMHLYPVCWKNIKWVSLKYCLLSRLKHPHTAIKILLYCKTWGFWYFNWTLQVWQFKQVYICTINCNVLVLLILWWLP